MADKKSSKYPHKWPDGTFHSVPWEQTKRAQAGAVVAPPPGSYDPNLDAQQRGVNRGLDDLIADIGPDTGRQRVRAQDDFAVGLGSLQQGRERTTQDYNTGVGQVEQGYQRNLSDLLKSREQGTQDYGTNVATLQRNYQNLGTAQGEGQRKAGAYAGSGAALQAARKRTANEAIDRSPIDTAYQRFMDSSRTGEGRLGEDRKSTLDTLKLGYDRGGEDFQTSKDQLGLAFNRQDADWTTQLERARREAGQFGRDIGETKVAQFVQNYPGEKLPILYPGMAPPPVKSLTVTAGPGVAGTTTRRKKKGKTTIETYTNRLPYGP